VLPLENLSGDPAQDYFADGMTEAIIGRLARIPAVRVISRPSIMHYKGTHKPLREIAHELNVDGVIAGTVQRSGGRLRVTTQLIHATTDAHLWAREYDRDLTDVLSLESDIAGAVAEEIRVQVTAEERARLASAQRVHPQAHEAYLLGRYYFSKRNQRDLTRAIDSFERATQPDTKVIVISGETATQIATENPADAFLRKPFIPPTLLQCIQRVLSSGFKGVCDDITRTVF
jgi:TolB-like protein